MIDGHTTKEKILKTAKVLFAQNDVSSVGVREIAKEAQVNIAAINYHFGNKETLYFKSVEYSMNQMVHDIDLIWEDAKDKSPSTISLLIFRYFMNHSHELRMGFKLIMETDQFPKMSEEFDNMIGPPGGRILYKSIKELKPNLSEDEIVWAVRTIFSQILHKALILCGESKKTFHERLGVDNEYVEKSLIRLVQLVVSDLN